MKFSDQKTMFSIELRQAVKEWMLNSDAAEAKYGHISDWDVRKVATVAHMFGDATSFNQDISKWEMSNCTDMERMFEESESIHSTPKSPKQPWS